MFAQFETVQRSFVAVAGAVFATALLVAAATPVFPIA